MIRVSLKVSWSVNTKYLPSELVRLVGTMSKTFSISRMLVCKWVSISGEMLMRGIA